jgi:uncharacterized protein
MMPITEMTMEQWLTPHMKEHLAGREIAFIASVDSDGACHTSLQTGPPGFVRVLDDTTLMYPVYETDALPAGGRVGLLLADRVETGPILHVDGRVRIIEHAAVEAFAPLLRRVAGLERFDDVVDGRRRIPARWVLVDIVTARIDGSAPVVAPAPPPAEPPPVAAEPVDDDELSYLLPPAWQAA